MEISIENEIEASQRQKLDHSSPNMRSMKFWQHNQVINSSPNSKDYSSLVAAEVLNSTLLTPVEDPVNTKDIKAS
jgi:hypothetical protein